LALAIDCVQRPEPKKPFHLFAILLQNPVKKRNKEITSSTKAQFAMVVPVDSPKLIVIAIILGGQNI
jgi:hypothetical protein